MAGSHPTHASTTTKGYHSLPAAKLIWRRCLLILRCRSYHRDADKKMRGRCLVFARIEIDFVRTGEQSFETRVSVLETDMLSRLGCFLCVCTICDDSRRRRARNTTGVLLRRVQSKPLHSKLDIHDDRWSRQLSIPHSLLLCATCSIANFFKSEHQRRNARQHL